MHDTQFLYGFLQHRYAGEHRSSRRDDNTVIYDNYRGDDGRGGITSTFKEEKSFHCSGSETASDTGSVYRGGLASWNFRNGGGRDIAIIGNSYSGSKLFHIRQIKTRMIYIIYAF